MKKVTASILGLCLVSGLFAQNKEADKNFYLGIIAMPTLSWAKEDSKNIAPDGSKFGISLGLTGDLMFSKNYAFSFDLLHVITGVKVKADSVLINGTPRGDVAFDYSIRAFQIPISLKFRTNEIGYMTYWVQAGIAPSVSYRTRVDISPATHFPNPDDAENRNPNENEDDFKVSNTGNNINPTNWLEEDDISTIRVPLMFGLGAEYNLSGNTSLVGAFRYEYGLGNFMKADNTKAYRSALGFMLGIRF
jgi:hypothetical protein